MLQNFVISYEENMECCDAIVVVRSGALNCKGKMS